MIYRSSWSLVAPHRFFAKLRVLHLVNFTDGTVFQTFFLYPCRYCADFWHVSQLPPFLKAAYKDRHISYIIKDNQIPSFTSKRIYLQEYMQPVGDLVLPCNTFRMLVVKHFILSHKTSGSVLDPLLTFDNALVYYEFNIYVLRNVGIGTIPELSCAK